MIEIKSQARSHFVGYLGVKNYSEIEKNLILPTVRKFFEVRGIHVFKPINEQAAISDLDFNRKKFDNFFAHFYDFIVSDINKNGDDVEAIVKYCITLDETNCSKTCEKTQIRYDEILLFDQPVFYFIYVDIKDIFASLRSVTIVDFKK
ncbi:hypothetical protein [Crenothrix sp.]|uniref:hypothetical protein n=1 Tax=Crenothrix sp. TaxID=3100433 RepID=UPI00374CC204